MKPEIAALLSVDPASLSSAERAELDAHLAADPDALATAVALAAALDLDEVGDPLADPAPPEEPGPPRLQVIPGGAVPDAPRPSEEAPREPPVAAAAELGPRRRRRSRVRLALALAAAAALGFAAWQSAPPGPDPDQTPRAEALGRLLDM